DVGDLNGDGKPDFVTGRDQAQGSAVFIVENVHPSADWRYPFANYPFAGNARDLSPGAHDGTVLGAEPVPDRFGNANNAYEFDGVQAHVELPKLGLGLKISVSAWFALADAPATNGVTILGQGVSDTQRWFFSATPDSLLWFDQRAAGSDNGSYRIPVSLSPGTWHHVVAVTSPDYPINAKVEVYLDGTWAGSLSTRSFVELDSTYDVGRTRTESGWLYSQGKVDNLEIYDFLLNPTDVQQLREEVIGGNACPLLVAGPSPQFVEPGASFKLTVSAVGVDLSYRWLKNRNLLPIDRPTLVVTNARAADAGLYAAIAYNACSSVTSSPVRVLVNSDTDGDGLTDPYEQGFTRYQIIQQNFTPAQARADAEARGGHLATITSQAEWE